VVTTYRLEPDSGHCNAPRFPKGDYLAQEGKFMSSRKRFSPEQIFHKGRGLIPFLQQAMKYHTIHSYVWNRNFVFMNTILVFLTIGLLLFRAYPVIPAACFMITVLMGILSGRVAFATFTMPGEFRQ
jgi:hypothetical protein